MFVGRGIIDPAHLPHKGVGYVGKGGEGQGKDDFSAHC